LQDYDSGVYPDPDPWSAWPGLINRKIRRSFATHAGPPALFAFPLPSLAHTSWQNRWFKSGPRNQKIPSFQQFPRTPQPSELTILRLAEESTSLEVFAYPLKLY
jgi:hypothetical protein